MRAIRETHMILVRICGFNLPDNCSINNGLWNTQSAIMNLCTKCQILKVKIIRKASWPDRLLVSIDDKSSNNWMFIYQTMIDFNRTVRNEQITKPKQLQGQGENSGNSNSTTYTTPYSLIPIQNLSDVSTYGRIVWEADMGLIWFSSGNLRR